MKPKDYLRLVIVTIFISLVIAAAISLFVHSILALGVIILIAILCLLLAKHNYNKRLAIHKETEVKNPDNYFVIPQGFFNKETSESVYYNSEMGFYYSKQKPGVAHSLWGLKRSPEWKEIKS